MLVTGVFSMREQAAFRKYVYAYQNFEFYYIQSPICHTIKLANTPKSIVIYETPNFT